MSILFSLFIFIVWSSIVCIFASLLHRKKSSINTRPEFWLVCFCICFLPLFPIPSFEQIIPLPEILQVGNGFNNIIQIIESKVADITKFDLNIVESWIIAGLALLSSIGLMRFGLGLLKTQQIIKKSEPFKLDNVFTEEQRVLLNKFQVNVKLTDENISPFSFGLFKVYLILPRFILEFPNQQIKLLIDHEITHIEKQDHRWLILIKLVEQLFCFNPLLKWFERNYINAVELRCDNHVLCHTRDMNIRKNYAEAILRCLKQCVGFKEQALVAHFSNPATGVSFYHTRLKAIMSLDSKSASVKQLLLTSFFMILTGVSVNVLSSNFITDNINGWQPPLKYIQVTSPYGSINSIRNNVAHGGVDFKAAIGTPVYSVRAGVVTVANSTSLHPNYGNVIVVKHSDGYLSIYAHLKNFNVSKNEKVLAGQLLGLTGNTGKTSGPHLHLEILEGEQRIDPKKVITF